MAHAAFDTLSMAQRLERDFDFPPKQAEGTALLLHEHITGNVASKEDISALKNDISALKNDISALKNDISALEKRFDEKLDIRFAASDAKLDACIADLKSDNRWVKIIGAAVFTAIILPWLAELTKYAFS